jgi:hypothetical protein
MGRTIRGTLLVVPALLLVTLAVGVSGASAALPEFGRCVVTETETGGRYSDPGCIEKAKKSHGAFTGSFEWQPAEEIDLEPLELNGPMTFETADGSKIECPLSSENNDAVVTGPKSEKTPLWVFNECASEGGECHSAVSIEPGEITNSFAWHEEAGEEGENPPGWVGKLGWVTKGAEPTVGVEYAVKNDERLFPPVSCAGALGTIWLGGERKGHDSFISTITPTNTMSRVMTEQFSVSAPGISSPAKLLHKGASYLQAFRENGWERMAIAGSWSEHLGRRGLEIKTLP